MSKGKKNLIMAYEDSEVEITVWEEDEIFFTKKTYLEEGIVHSRRFRTRTEAVEQGHAFIGAEN